jgi:hypothetical protein
MFNLRLLDSIEALGSCTKLRSLDLRHCNNIESIDPLASCNQLQGLKVLYTLYTLYIHAYCAYTHTMHTCILYIHIHTC